MKAIARHCNLQAAYRSRFLFSMTTNHTQRGFIRIRGIHILLWLMLSLLLQYIYYDPRAALAPQVVSTLIVTGMCALPAYYGANRLVPGLLYRKRIGAFSGALALAAVLNSGLTYGVVGIFYQMLTGRQMFSSFRYFASISSLLIFANSIVIATSCAVKIIADRFSMEERLHEVEKEKISTELAFLRSQVNPHFLFNVLNTIYFQIHKENTEARGSVENLSELLRYQLYECTTDKIGINRELAYIRNYVAMQQLRMEAGTDVSLRMQPDIGAFKIAPLLILPLVENAFKHISHHKNPAQNKLHIMLGKEGGDQFIVQVSNTYDAANGATHLLASSGLGLQNLRRRLALLYPDAHSLDVRRHDAIFETTLKIKYGD